MRPLNPALRMEASPKPLMMKDKKSSPVKRKERTKKVPIHEAPIQLASINFRACCLEEELVKPLHIILLTTPLPFSS